MKILDIASRDLAHIDMTLLKGTFASPHTLIMPSDTPAMHAARIIDANEPGLVVLTNEQAEIEGILHPQWVLNGVAQHKGKVFETLVDVIVDFQDDPAEAIRGFHHEWLSGRHPLFLCPSGTHYVARLPCPWHP